MVGRLLPIEGPDGLVDDGLATGSTMRAAVLAVRRLRPAGLSWRCRLELGRPARGFAEIADEVVCPLMPEPFSAARPSACFDFSQTTDDEVRQLLSSQGAAAPASGVRDARHRGHRRIRRHAVPVDLESAAQRLLEAIDPRVCRC